MKKIDMTVKQLALLFAPMLFVFWCNMFSVAVTPVPGVYWITLLMTAFGALVAVYQLKKKPLPAKGLLIPLAGLGCITLVTTLLFCFTNIPNIFSFPFAIRQTSDSILWLCVFAWAYAIGRNGSDASRKMTALAYTVPVFALLHAGVIKANAGQGIPELSMIYYLLLLLPFVFSLKNKPVMWTMFLLIWIRVLLSVKRTAFLALAAALVTYLAVRLYTHRHEFSFKKRSFLLKGAALLMVLVVSTVICTVDDPFAPLRNLAQSLVPAASQAPGELVPAPAPTPTSSVNLFDRMTTTGNYGGPRRMDIWKHTAGMLAESSPMELIFGHGFNAVYHLSELKLSAHSDLLEVLYDYGILGFVCCMGFCLYLVCRFRYILQNKTHFAAAYAVSIVLLGCMIPVSHLIIYPTYFLFLCVFWGVLMGECDRETNSRR